MLIRSARRRTPSLPAASSLPLPSLGACFHGARGNKLYLRASTPRAAPTADAHARSLAVHRVRHRARGVSSSGHISARFRVMSACSLDARSLNIRDRAARCAVDEPSRRCLAANFSAAGPNFSRGEPAALKHAFPLPPPAPPSPPFISHRLPAPSPELVPAPGLHCFASGARRDWVPSMRRMNLGRKPWL